MSAFYNDNDPAVCAWLRELIAAGHLPPGVVSEKSISDLTPDELNNHTQVHLFAGIGGWPYALRLAGIPDDFPVWTGSCPCQPFSCAGKGGGTSDPRHLWPEMRRLIEQCQPTIVFGEQVASKAGREWLDGVKADLEATGYAFGASRLPAISVGHQHIRYRFYFVAHTVCEGLEGLHEACRQVDLQPAPGHLRRIREATPRVLTRANGFSRKLDSPPFCKEQIKGYGNAIVPPLAAEFIQASIEAILELQGR